MLAALLDELDAKLHGDAPTVAQLAELPLLDRVIKESMRILTATPVLFIRVLAREAALGPYVLPEAANVVLSPLLTHRDPDLFPEPARFRPERWEGLSPSPHEYLPFGAGPRMCLGAGFANLTLRVVLPMILQRYRFTVAHGARVDRKVRGITLGPKHGIRMLIAPQDRHFARREGVRGDIHELVDLS